MLARFACSGSQSQPPPLKILDPPLERCAEQNRATVRRIYVGIWRRDSDSVRSTWQSWLGRRVRKSRTRHSVTFVRVNFYHGHRVMFAALRSRYIAVITFLLRDAMLTRYMPSWYVSVRPSVCLSVRHKPVLY